MANVQEHVFIDAPYVAVVDAFGRRLGLSAAATQGECSLLLVVPFADGRQLARDVTAKTKLLPGSANYTTHYGVSWPAGHTTKGIPTPGFTGSITLRAGEDYSETELELDGDYQAPGGLLGATFDDVVGRRIAHATIVALLDGMRRDLRATYAASEAHKQSPEIASPRVPA
jgi:hypothetical protein